MGDRERAGEGAGGRSSRSGERTAAPVAAPPLPVAALARRARNAKSAKDRHDAAYFALEASIRITLAARPPQDARSLARAPLGAWVAALRASDEPRREPALLSLMAHLGSVVDGVERRPATVSARALLDAFVAYRNRVVGHGATRPASFYGPAGEALLAGLGAAWEAGLFLPAGARLSFVESIEVGRDGVRLARLLDLSREAPVVLDPGGTPVAGHVLPERVYVSLDDGALRDAGPWLAFRSDGVRERLYVFNGLGRGAGYLDYVSGEVLSGGALEDALPGLAGEAARIFGGAAEFPAVEGAAAPAEDAAGERLGGYRLVRRIGAGGMGVVHEALDEGLGRRVALKALPLALAGDARARERFVREVGALARCDHENVVKILDSGEAQGVPFFTMELIEGADLAALAERAARGDADALAAIGAAPADRARRLSRMCRDAARGLHHLHEHGIVHRDVKPANIVIAAEDGRAVVMDLGAALTGDGALTLSRDAARLTGTLRTMAPEQLRRGVMPVDRRADVYGLGATLYELLSGRPLFDGRSEAELVTQVLHDEPAPLARVAAGLPRDLAVIVHRCLQKDARARYESADALACDLDALLESRPIAARAPTVGYLLALALRRNPAAYAVGALLTVCLAAVAVAGALRLEHERRAADRRAEIARAALYALVENVERRVAGDGSDLAVDLRREVAEQAVASLDALASLDGAAITTGTARALNSLASLSRFDPTLPGWDRDTSRAVAAARELFARAAPGDIEPARVLVTALTTRGEFEYAHVRPDRARELYLEAIGHARTVCASGDARADDVEAAFLALQRLDTCEGALGASREAPLLEAEAMLRPWLARTDLAPAQRRLLLLNLATVLEGRAAQVAGGDAMRAAGLRAEAAELRRSAIGEAGDGRNASLERALASLKEGDARSEEEDPAGALSRYRAALDEMRRFAEANPKNPRVRRLATVALNRVGAVHERAGRLEEARAAYAEALAIRRERARAEGDAGARRDLCVSLDAMARISLRMGVIATATACAEEAAALTRARLTDESTSAITQADLIDALETLADARLATGDRAGATAALREAVERVAPFEGRMPSLRDSLARARARLASLEDEARTGGPPRREP